MSSIEELELDLEELKSLLEKASREQNKSLLSKEIIAVERKVEQARLARQVQESKLRAAAEEEKKQEIAGPDGNALDFKDMSFTPIKDYGWDQDKKGLIKVYLLKGLDKIGQHDKESI